MKIKEKTNNELFSERDAIEREMLRIEEAWHTEGKTHPEDAIEYENLSRLHETLTAEIRHPNRWNGP